MFTQFILIGSKWNINSTKTITTVLVINLRHSEMKLHFWDQVEKRTGTHWAYCVRNLIFDGLPIRCVTLTQWIKIPMFMENSSHLNINPGECNLLYSKKKNAKRVVTPDKTTWLCSYCHVLHSKTRSPEMNCLTLQP